MEIYSEEWFDALTRVNPDQAAKTREVLKIAGRNDVCGICGDDPASDYEVVGVPVPARLCSDCRMIQESMGNKFKPLS